MTRPHQYVDCDVPEGMTLREYRAAKRPAKPRRPTIVTLLRRRRPERPVAPEREAA